MKERTLIITLIVILFSSLAVFFFTFNRVLLNQPLLAPVQPDFPTSCSSSEIQALWSSIFTNQPNPPFTIVSSGSSTGICEKFFVFYEQNPNQDGDVIYILSGLTNTTANITYIAAYHGAFDRDFGNNLRGPWNNSYTEISQNLPLDQYGRIVDDADFFNKYMDKNPSNRNPPVSGTASANSVFTSIFTQIPTTWTDQSLFYYFKDNLSSQGTQVNVSGNVSKDKIYESFHYTKIMNLTGIPLPCESNWTQVNSSCSGSPLTKTITYVDLNNCGNSPPEFDPPYGSVLSCSCHETGNCGVCTSPSNVSWTCDSWSPCSGGIRTRNCVNDYECSPSQEPFETISCAPSDINQCNLLSSEVIGKIIELERDGEKVILRENTPVAEDQYFPIKYSSGSSIFEVDEITNNAGFLNDEIQLSDIISNENYEPVPVQEGFMTYIFQGLQYNLAYNSTTLSTDFPQNGYNSPSWTFLDCSIVPQSCYTTCEQASPVPQWGSCSNLQRNRTCSDNCGGTLFETQGCSTSPCSPYWVQINQTCMSNDLKKTYWNNTNPSCTNMTGFPENVSMDCDYNSLGFIGAPSNIQTEGILEIENGNDGILIDDDEYNSTKNYTGEESIKIIDEDGITRIEFEHDFDDGPINFRNIKLISQRDSDAFGYLVVQGLEEENDKTLRINKKTNAARVCIEDRSIASISAISASCTSQSEHIINCPGTGNGFSCSLVGDIFVISGLDNSGVKEYNGTALVNPSSGSGQGNTCTPSWNCGSFSACSNGIQTRTCTDSNNCNTTTGKPFESQTCTQGSGNGSPGSNSGTSGSTGGTSTTKKEPDKTFIIVLIVLAVLLIIVAIIVILALLNRRKRKQYSQKDHDFSPRYSVNPGPPRGPPSSPGSQFPRIPMNQPRIPGR